MDRTAIIVVTICVILLFTWPSLLQEISPIPPQTAQSTNATPAQVGKQNAPVPAPLAQAEPASTLKANTIHAPVVLESEKLIRLDTDESVYTFSSAGGLKTVGLVQHKAKPCNGNGSKNHDVILMNHGVELPVFALEGIDDGEFSLTSNLGLITMVSTNQAGIRITKEFKADTNYLLHSTITLTNPSKEPVTLEHRRLVLGTSMPLQSGGQYPVWGAPWHNGEEMEDLDDDEQTKNFKHEGNVVYLQKDE